MKLKKTSPCLLTVVVYPFTPSDGFPLYRISSDDTISNTVHFRSDTVITAYRRASKRQIIISNMLSIKYRLDNHKIILIILSKIRHKKSSLTIWSYEPQGRKTGLRGFRPGPTQTRLYSHRRWLETWNLGFRKQRDCTIQVAKTKALISFAVIAKLICIFVFAYAKIWFSHVAAHMRESLSSGFPTRSNTNQAVHCSQRKWL